MGAIARDWLAGNCLRCFFGFSREQTTAEKGTAGTGAPARGILGLRVKGKFIVEAWYDVESLLPDYWASRESRCSGSLFQPTSWGSDLAAGPSLAPPRDAFLGRSGL